MLGLGNRTVDSRDWMVIIWYAGRQDAVGG